MLSQVAAGLTVAVQGETDCLGRCARADLHALKKHDAPGPHLLHQLAAGLPVAVTLCRGSQVALDVVRGLVFMHSKQMIHLDLKSSNSKPCPFSGCSPGYEKL